jgi:Lon protease-like protein
VLPLLIFEERYRLLVRERRDFGVVLIRRGSEVGPGGAEDLRPVGTIATLQRVEKLPDGRFSVVARGLYRFRLHGLDHSQLYLQGHVERLEDPPAPVSARLMLLLQRYLSAYGVDLEPHLTPDLVKRSVWLVGSVLQTEAGVRQRLLESADPALAERLLEQELGKLDAVGRMGTIHARPPSPN